MTRPHQQVPSHQQAARQLSRRSFLASASALGLSPSLGFAAGGFGSRCLELEAEFERLMVESGVPGCAAGRLEDGRLVWSQGFGFADLERERAMTADTLLNIGSVTKTITATAVLQLIAEGMLNLDDDVAELLDFPMRNPRHPEVPITTRQLLTHRSSILDGDAYANSYVCGDQPQELGAWLAEYFTAGGVEAHFHTWAPGTEDPPSAPRAYSNVAFGLLGHLVHVVGGQPYEDACREYVFDPLGMKTSGFLIGRIDTERHAVPYSRVEDNYEAGDELPSGGLPRYPLAERPPVPGELFPHCLYSFATPPDGLLRTSVNELASFLGAWINGGTTPGGEPLLDGDIVDLALTDSHYGRELCWDRMYRAEGEPLVYHDGGDPGISTFMGFRPEARDGLILLFNTSDPGDMLGAGIRLLMDA